MPLRPGVQVTVLTTPPPRSTPTDTGVWFVAGLTDAGRVDQPILIRSLSDVTTFLGGRVSYSPLYDALDLFFREGGNTAYVSRVVGPGATKASKNLLDGSAGTSLIVSGLGPGAWYSTNVKVGVVAGVASGTYQIQVADANNNILEQSGDLTTQADAVAWAVYSNYISIAIGASSLVPAVVALGLLTGGSDDRASVTDTQWLAALNRFTKDLGPGNVSSPGRTTDPAHTQLLDHAFANNRVAMLDYPDTATTSTVTTSATNAKSTNHGQYGGGFWPWIVVPGVTPSTTRTVPPSALAAGISARVDAVRGPGVAAAGNRGISRYGIALSQAGVDDTTRDTLNTAGVNVVRLMAGAVEIYGWRSLADPNNNPVWLPLGTVRYIMGLTARLYSVGQSFVFEQIDGQGKTISAYQGALTSVVQADWENGEIYGATSTDAYNVDTGPSINTPTVLAGNELRAAVSVRPSPMGELVTINIINVPITQAVS